MRGRWPWSGSCLVSADGQAIAVAELSGGLRWFYDYVGVCNRQPNVIKEVVKDKETRVGQRWTRLRRRSTSHYRLAAVGVANERGGGRLEGKERGTRSSWLVHSTLGFRCCLWYLIDGHFTVHHYHFCLDRYLL